jgi:hypothetical protein
MYESTIWIFPIFLDTQNLCVVNEFPNDFYQKYMKFKKIKKIEKYICIIFEK